MNRVVLIGRLTAKPGLKSTTSNVPITKITLAVKRDKEKSDFINCIAFNKTAEMICQYFDKGSQIGVEGKIQTGSYEKDGKKISTTDVVVDNITFLDKKEVTPQDFVKKEETDIFADFGSKIEQDQVNIDDSFLE